MALFMPQYSSSCFLKDEHILSPPKYADPTFLNHCSQSFIAIGKLHQEQNCILFMKGVTRGKGFREM